MTKCPFCQCEINQSNVLYYFDHKISKDSFSEPLSKIYRGIFLNHNRVEQGHGYVSFWSERSGLHEPQGAQGFVLCTDELDELAGAVGVKAKNGVYAFGNGCVDLSGDTPFIKSGTMTYRPAALACPDCENLLPLDYLTSKCVNIALVGSSKTGKTTMLLSLLSDNFRNLTGQCEGKLKVTRSFDCTDGYVRNFWDRMLSGFQENGRVPDASDQPLPPLFIRMEWELPQGGQFSHNLCLIDTQGDVFQDDERAKKTLSLLETCDGILYCVDPSQSISARGRGTTVKSNRGIAPGTAVGRPVIAPPTGAVSPEKNSASGDPAMIYERYFRTDRRWEGKKCAFVLTKLDKYIDISAKYDIIINEFPYGRFLTTSSGAPSEREELLDFTGSVYRQMAAQAVFQKEFPTMPTPSNCAFKSPAYFAVSSFSGDAMPDRTKGSGLYVKDRQKRNCLFVHEPLMWLLSEIVPVLRRQEFEELSSRLIKSNA